MRKICIFIGSRANYSSIKSVMRAVQQHPALVLQLVVGASASGVQIADELRRSGREASSPPW